MDPSEKNVFDLGTQLTRYNAYDNAIAVFRFGIEKHSRSSQLRVGLGVALYSANRYDEAAEVLLTAVKLDPKDQRPFLFLGKIADFSSKMADQLVGTLAEIVRQHPKNAAANYCYAVSLWGRNAGREDVRNLPQVEQLFKTAVALDPTLYDAHFRLGILYQEQGRFDAAIRAFEQALKLEPEQYTPHFRLAQIYRRIGELDKERQHMDAYVRLREQATKEVKGKP
jgi:tetratricopeptide (TPR) repeat protein